MNWNLFGMNPNFKDFMEKHPDKTMIGLMWSMQWRWGIFFFVMYLFFILAIILLTITFGFLFR